jgi:hypothetical protein
LSLSEITDQLSLWIEQSLVELTLLLDQGNSQPPTYGLYRQGN